MFSLEVKQALTAQLPSLTIADVLGSTEGGMGMSFAKKGATAETAKFRLNPTTRVFKDDGTEVKPGSGEIGMIANGGMVPLAYYKDPEKSARTFKEVNGQRYSFPGDMATVEADGTITLLGRGSVSINSGGEKIFPEEVELALKSHPAVFDVVVVGVPDERWGERVVAVVKAREGQQPSVEELATHARERIAGYKVPREVHLVDEIVRSPSGKADYRWAKAQATDGGS